MCIKKLYQIVSDAEIILLITRTPSKIGIRRVNKNDTVDVLSRRPTNVGYPMEEKLIPVDRIF